MDSRNYYSDICSQKVKRGFYPDSPDKDVQQEVTVIIHPQYKTIFGLELT